VPGEYNRQENAFFISQKPAKRTKAEKKARFQITAGARLCRRPAAAHRQSESYTSHPRAAAGKRAVSTLLPPFSPVRLFDGNPFFRPGNEPQVEMALKQNVIRVSIRHESFPEEEARR
jgi:hypothetical protein